MEFEQQLTDLFERDNRCYFFTRFCLSLEKVAIDPEILEKIP